MHRSVSEAIGRVEQVPDRRRSPARRSCYSSSTMAEIIGGRAYIDQTNGMLMLMYGIRYDGSAEERGETPNMAQHGGFGDGRRGPPAAGEKLT
jgi:hypothetical protein